MPLVVIPERSYFSVCRLFVGQLRSSRTSLSIHTAHFQLLKGHCTSLIDGRSRAPRTHLINFIPHPPHPQGGMNLVRIKEIREAVADTLTIERYESKRGW